MTVTGGIPKPQREGGPIVAEAEPCPSLVSDLLNGVGGKGWKPMDARTFGTAFWKLFRTYAGCMGGWVLEEGQVWRWFGGMVDMLDVLGFTGAPGVVEHQFLHFRSSGFHPSPSFRMFLAKRF